MFLGLRPSVINCYAGDLGTLEARAGNPCQVNVDAVTFTNHFINRGVGENQSKSGLIPTTETRNGHPPY